MSLSSTVNETLSLISQNLKRSRDPEDILSAVIYHACISNHVYQSGHEICMKCLASPISKI